MLCDKVNAISRTNTIATLIGRDAIQNTLIPYYLSF